MRWKRSRMLFATSIATILTLSVSLNIGHALPKRALGKSTFPSTRKLLTVRPYLPYLEYLEKDTLEKDRAPPQKQATVIDAISIIAGTSIGGGFLALPFATAPAGFVPSSIGLVACWFFLVGCGLTFAEVTIARLASEKDPASANISVLSVAESAGGQAFGLLAGLLFAVRCLCTLGAQDSKAGDLVGMALEGLGLSSIPFPLAVALPAVGAGLLTFKVPPRLLDKVNTVLTGGLLVSFAAIVACGAQQGLDLSLLQRADWQVLLPRFASTAGAAAAAQQTAAVGLEWCIPVFLQLLCFMEVIPVVCARLGPQRPQEIQKAVVAGSLLPLFMCLAWSAVAAGLVPFDPSLAGQVASDPINILLRSGLPIRVPVTCLAAGAIGTTLIGTYLTCSVFASDLAGKLRGHNVASDADKKLGQVATVALPVLLALGGPKVFYTLTAFAGSLLYVLWGLIPAVSALALKKKQRQQAEERVAREVQLCAATAAVQRPPPGMAAAAEARAEGAVAGDVDWSVLLLGNTVGGSNGDKKQPAMTMLPGDVASLVALIGVACVLIVSNAMIQLRF